MKLKFSLVLGSAVILLAGCVTTNHELVLETVGPGPDAVRRAKATEGTLVVYSAYEANADFNARDPRRPEYSAFWIYSADGRLHRQVQNNSGTILQRPQGVSLPVGGYRVVAQANGYGSVTVPVIIGPGQDTLVHLEGGFRWPDQFSFNQTNAVRLPDGVIVGWKGAADTNAP